MTCGRIVGRTLSFIPLPGGSQPLFASAVHRANNLKTENPNIFFFLALKKKESEIISFFLRRIVRGASLRNRESGLWSVDVFIFEPEANRGLVIKKNRWQQKQ